jgi:hypothetical protein
MSCMLKVVNKSNIQSKTPSIVTHIRDNIQIYRFRVTCENAAAHSRNVILCVMTELTVNVTVTQIIEISAWLSGHKIPRLLPIYRRKHTNFCVLAILSCKSLSYYLTTLSIWRLYSVKWRDGPKWSWPERGAIQ